MSFYTKRRLAFATQDLQQPVQLLRELVAGYADASLWGIWHGIFGMASNELMLVTAHDDHKDDLDLPENVRVLEEYQLRATARPTDSTSLSQPGIYVFRDFSLDGKDVEEVVALSSAAWQTFETGENYAAQPMGLFAPQTLAPNCVMHLLTWYPDFTSWQNSRESGPQALQRFAARRALTYLTIAVATRLNLS
jgi:hypothetical protein